MALATQWSTTNTIGIDITAIWSSASNTGTYMEGVTPYAPFDAGMIAYGLNGAIAAYCKIGTGGITGVGYAGVVLLGDYTNVVMMSNSVGSLQDKVGIFLGVGAAIAGDYGWFQFYGSCPSIRTNAAVAVSTAMASTSTAGALDDATTTGTKNITNIVLTTAATTGGLSPGQLNWPVISTTN